MGRLFLIHDFSPARPWLYALLHANRKSLAGQNLIFAPLNTFDVDWQLSHQHFFVKFPVGKQLPKNIKNLWTELGKRLAGGQDVLAFSHRPFLSAHEGFWEILPKYSDIAKNNIHQLMIFAPPSVIIEGRYREFPLLKPEKDAEFIKACASLLTLAEDAEARLGKENVKFIANLNKSAAALPNYELGAKVLEFLERDADLEKADSFLFPARFKSAAARQLSRMTGVRWNVGNPLDTEAYSKTLFALDQGWGEDFASPLSLRSQLNAEHYPQIGLLEKKLSLPAGAFAPPEEYLTIEPVNAPLAPERASAFAAALPAQTRLQLRERYEADEILLSPNQRMLLTALRREAPQNQTDKASQIEFTRIEGGEPPLELTVLTMAFNHEKYIAECMDSVLMQKTSFPVRHIVLDHNSSDETPRIIRQYAQKYPSIQPVLLSRRVHKENVLGLFLRCRSKYAALCDGDDYFYSPDKLQKQVDYLESRPHCSMCFHPVAVTFEDGTAPFRFPPIDMLPLNKKMEFHLAQLTKNNFIQTNSALYRWRFRDGLPSWFRADICPGDWYWHMLHAEIGRVGFLPETMSVYRRHKGALYNTAYKDPEAHWRNQGMSELNAYQVFDEHFKGRYFKNFSALASRIFASFTRIADKEGDSSLLDMARERFPRFALDFYQKPDNLDRLDQDKKPLPAALPRLDETL